MRARFIGDPNDDFSGPASIRHLGIDWPKDRWVKNVPDDLRDQLAGHSHFEIGADAASEPEAAAVAQEPAQDAAQPEPGPVEPAEASATPGPAPEAEPEPAEEHADIDATAPRINPPDQDGDGKPGGSTSSPEKDAIIAELEKIAGAEFDRRWGVPKLKAALEAARFMAGDD